MDPNHIIIKGQCFMQVCPLFFLYPLARVHYKNQFLLTRERNSYNFKIIAIILKHVQMVYIGIIHFHGIWVTGVNIPD